MDDILIDKKQVAQILGITELKKVDGLIQSKNFPKPAHRMSGKPGLARNFFRRSEIIAWHELDKLLPRDAAGKRRPENLLGRSGESLSSIKNTEAVRFVSGQYDSPSQQRLREIRKKLSRRNGGRVLQTIRTEGDWG